MRAYTLEDELPQIQSKLRRLIGSKWKKKWKYIELRSFKENSWMLVGETKTGRLIGVDISVTPLPNKRRMLMNFRDSIRAASKRLQELEV